MDTLAPLGHALYETLSAAPNAHAIAVGFTQRRSKLTAARFTQALVGGWLANPDASLAELSQVAAATGVRITPQGLDQRFTPAAAACLQRVLAAAVAQAVAAQPVAAPLLERFAGVHLYDSTVVGLPVALAGVWCGCGNDRVGTAAVKLQVRWNWSTGALLGPVPQPGRDHDRCSPLLQAPLPPGALRLADQGYLNFDEFAQLSRSGVYWLSRLGPATRLFDATGQQWDLGAFLRTQPGVRVDMPLQVGHSRLPVRFLAVKVPPEVAEQRRRRIHEDARRRGKTRSVARLALADWNFWITNVPVTLLALDEALVLARVRWQVELLFKLWKQHGRLGHSRGRKPWRVLCELYAKLLALVIQHWLILVSGWQYLDRSLVKAAAVVRKLALPFILTLSQPDQLGLIVTSLQRCLAAGCRVSRRRKLPPTFRLLQGVALYA